MEILGERGAELQAPDLAVLGLDRCGVLRGVELVEERVDVGRVLVVRDGRAEDAADPARCGCQLAARTDTVLRGFRPRLTEFRVRMVELLPQCVELRGTFRGVD